MRYITQLTRAIEELASTLRATITTQPSGACSAVRLVPRPGGLASELQCVYLHGHNGIHRDPFGITWADLNLAISEPTPVA